MTETIHILMSCDNNYAPWAYATIKSIATTTKSPIEIHLASHKISPENQKKLKSLKGKLVKISIFELDEALFKDCPANERLPISSYVRLFAPTLFPNLAKILWLDCDLLVCSDLIPLWETNIDEYPCAAVKDINSNEMTHYLGFSDGFCINAGVLLMNLDFMRTHHIQEAFSKTMQTKTHLIRYGDQCVVNMTLHNQIYELPSVYNSALTRSNDDKIIHFVWDKPWDKKAFQNIYQIKYLTLLWYSPYANLYKPYRKKIIQYFLPSIKKFLFSREKTEKTKKYKICGITIIKKRKKGNKKIVYLLGIPVFYKTARL